MKKTRKNQGFFVSRKPLVSVIFLFLVLNLILIANAMAYEANNSNYKFSFAITSTSQSNVSSANYNNKITSEAISGNASSANYNLFIGFIRTLFYANGESCSVNSDCLGGYCCSSLCQATGCPTAETATGGGVGGGSAGGGGAPKKKAVEEFSLSETEFKADLIINEPSKKTIIIKNTGTETVKYEISVEDIQDYVKISETSFELNPGEEKTFTIEFLTKELGVYTGRIVVKSGTITKYITVLINIKTKLSLIDISLDIPREYKLIRKGDVLKSQISISNMLGTKEELTLTYVIKDSSGRIVLEETEKINVEQQASFTKTFNTDNLRGGNYILAAEARAGNSFSASADMFRIESGIIGEMLAPLAPVKIYAVVVLVLIIVLFTGLIIHRNIIRIKEKRKIYK